MPELRVFLASDGRMGALTRDGAVTSIGDWPHWGPAFRFLSNDAWAAALAKGP